MVPHRHKCSAGYLPTDAVTGEEMTFFGNLTAANAQKTGCFGFYLYNNNHSE
jgi:hypothetical protein